MTSYHFSISTTDETYGFDYYIVPSGDEFDKWAEGETFQHYSNKDCFGENWLNISGTCKGVSAGSGIMILMDSELTSPLVTITVQKLEIPNIVNSKSMLTSNNYIDFEKVPSAKIIHDTATIDVNIFGDTFDFSYSSYQNKDNSIRFENGNGRTIHKYTEHASIGQLFDSFGMSFTNDCLMFRDGRSFCNNEDYSFTFYVNGQTHYLLSQYVFEDGDNIKIIFGGIPKITSTTNIHPESKSIKSSLDTTSKITCGTGTELVNGICQVVQTEEKSSKGGGCLIATATYGSEMASEVQQLRELRDNSLLQTKSGTSFMKSFNDFYYTFSPIIADYERENPVFKEMVKIAITPMISSLSILNYVDMNSEAEVLGYGISLILLNVGMYLGVPAIVIVGIRKRI